MTTARKKEVLSTDGGARVAKREEFVARPLTQEEQIDRNIANMQRIAGSDKKQVVEFLKRAGILDKTGKLQAMS